MNAALEIEPLIDAKAVAKLLDVSPGWVYRHVDLKTLPHIRLGSLVKFDPVKIREFMRTGTNPPTNLTPFKPKSV